MAAEEAPLTGVAWAASPEAAPAGWTVISVTVEGAAANLGKGFGHKGGYLCVSTGGAQTPSGSVVTDLQLLSDRSPQPAGYSRVPEFPEPRTGGSRKKRLYVKLQPRDGAETAVWDLRVSGRGRALPQYLKIGELGGFAIWCKKGRLGPPVPPPRTLSAALQDLTLHPPAAQHRSPLRLQQDPLYASSVHAMDGVPFTLHPKFQTSLSSSTNPLLTALTVKSLADIEEEYNYAFVTERTAAARLPPSVC